LDSVKNEVTKTLMTVKIQSAEQADEAAQQMEARAEAISNVTYSAPTETGEVQTTVDSQTLAQGKSATATAAAAAVAAMGRVGRNDPCPCGSGKKFKQCHGKLA
jgi:preprotein translocase subunit SecA